MIETKKKFRLMWIDAYLLVDNWETIDNIKKVFPVSSYSIAGDGWVDCDHCYKFEAENLEQVEKIVDEYLTELGRIVDVFSVIDENNQVILTEEER